MGIPIVRDYQRMTKKQRIFFQLAFAKLQKDLEKEIPETEGQGKKNKYDKARDIVKRKKR